MVPEKALRALVLVLFTTSALGLPSTVSERLKPTGLQRREPPPKATVPWDSWARLHTLVDDDEDDDEDDDTGPLNGNNAQGQTPTEDTDNIMEDANYSSEDCDDTTEPPRAPEGLGGFSNEYWDGSEEDDCDETENGSPGRGN